MRFVLVGVGSLGDVLPHITLASELTSRGHRCIVIGLEPYAETAASLGVDYVSVPADTSALWPGDAMRRRLALAQPGLMYATMLRRLHGSAPLVNDVLLDVVKQGDVIVSGIVTAGAARLLGRELGASTIPVLFAPLLPARSAASSALAPAVGGSIAALIGSSVMWRLSEELAGAHTADMARRLHTRRIPPLGAHPSLLATSPVLTPPSSLWPRRLRQTGWIDPPTPDGPNPLGPDLLDFLSAENPPVLMTYGTCPVVSPARDVEMFLTAARAARTRVVLQSDAVSVGAINDTAFNAPGVPHTALMPRVAAVVHHGGAGTTYASLAAGRPAMVVPHLGDQGYYARRVHALGAGPRGVPRWRLTTSTLGHQLRSMIVGGAADGFARAASGVAGALSREDGRGTAVDALEELSGA